MPTTEQEKRELTEEEKKEYKRRGEEYQRLEYDIKEQIVQLELRKSKLEKELRDALPKTPNGRNICERCHVQSLKYTGRTPRAGLSGGQEIYECEICGKEIVVDAW